MKNWQYIPIGLVALTLSATSVIAASHQSTAAKPSTHGIAQAQVDLDIKKIAIPVDPHTGVDLEGLKIRSTFDPKTNAGKVKVDLKSAKAFSKHPNANKGTSIALKKMQFAGRKQASPLTYLSDGQFHMRIKHLKIVYNGVVFFNLSDLRVLGKSHLSDHNHKYQLQSDLRIGKLAIAPLHYREHNPVVLKKSLVCYSAKACDAFVGTIHTIHQQHHKTDHKGMHRALTHQERQMLDSQLRPVLAAGIGWNIKKLNIKLDKKMPALQANLRLMLKTSDPLVSKGLVAMIANSYDPNHQGKHPLAGNKTEAAKFHQALLKATRVDLRLTLPRAFVMKTLEQKFARDMMALKHRGQTIHQSPAVLAKAALTLMIQQQILKPSKKSDKLIMVIHHVDGKTTLNGRTYHPHEIHQLMDQVLKH